MTYLVWKQCLPENVVDVGELLAPHLEHHRYLQKRIPFLDGILPGIYLRQICTNKEQ